MNYERIILELMERIQILEEKVAMLEENNKASQQVKADAPVSKKSSLGVRAKEYILEQKRAANEAGFSEITLVCNDIQKVLGVVNRAPAICQAMYECMTKGDEVLYKPNSGMSTAVKVKYYLK